MAATIVSSAAVARLNATKRTGASVSGRVVARYESLRIRRTSLEILSSPSPAQTRVNRAPD